ncbi:hypothetical protein [Pseudomonas putida]|uniref:Uncharacterized protein n=1 Tax=Pseudomonas putida TaxID=303 RepID=A0A8I1EBD4_PSEPU|nr:hypothetical protein [Pseudomonas putida]MBI6882665.1 hypothetical protein [Pseudomonas putida]
MKVCLALANEASGVMPAKAGNLKECVRCRDWVRPVLTSTRRLSSKSNLPGLLGIIKSVSCCPQCGDKI